jgi:molecular chaperone DnaK
MSRNHRVGQLVIPVNDLKRDLRAGAEVEVTLRVNESRKVQVEAYIPDLDQDFAAKIDLESYIPDSEELRQELSAQQKRLRAAREAHRDVPDMEVEQRVGQHLGDIRDQGTVDDIERRVEAAQGGGNDEAKTADERLKDLAAKLDEIEGLLEWPTLEQQAVDELQVTRDAVEQYGEREQKEELKELEAELRAAIRGKDPEALRAKIDDLRRLRVRANLKNPGFWIAWFRYLEETPLENYTDRITAERLLQQGNEALNSNDPDSLENAVRQLGRLLPAEESQKFNTNLSGLI